jgi:hypothetical protein
VNLEYSRPPVSEICEAPVMLRPLAIGTTIDPIAGVGSMPSDDPEVGRWLEFRS